MLDELGFGLLALGVVAFAILSFRFLLDLFWMIFMSRWVMAATALTFVLLLKGFERWVGTVNLAALLALAATAVIVRPLIDLATWLYDLSPLEIAGSWPLLSLESKEARRIRLAERPTLTWDYFRERCELIQEAEFRDELDDIDAETEEDDAAIPKPTLRPLGS